jgi:hypothetical protein
MFARGRASGSVPRQAVGCVRAQLSPHILGQKRVTIYKDGSRRTARATPASFAHRRVWSAKCRSTGAFRAAMDNP